jgi:hypothetical protein
VTLLVDALADDAVLVRWLTHPRGSSGPVWRTHMASPGILWAEAGTWLTWCGQPVAEGAETPDRVRLDGPELCRQRAVRLVLPCLPLPMVAGWLRGAERRGGTAGAPRGTIKAC